MGELIFGAAFEEICSRLLQWRPESVTNVFMENPKALHPAFLCWSHNAKKMTYSIILENK